MKKCLVLLVLLGILGFAALGEEGFVELRPSQDEYFTLPGEHLAESELELVKGGRDPDQGTEGNFSRTAKDRIRDFEWRNTDTKVKVVLSGSLSYQKIEKLLNYDYGIDPPPEPGPWISGKIGPLNVKVKIVLHRGKIQ